MCMCVYMYVCVYVCVYMCVRVCVYLMMVYEHFHFDSCYKYSERFYFL